jgi:hypothetical protein
MCEVSVVLFCLIDYLMTLSVSKLYGGGSSIRSGNIDARRGKLRVIATFGIFKKSKLKKSKKYATN